LPDGAHFTTHCEWECGEGYFRPRGQDTCVRCTNKCPAGRRLRGECPAGSRFDAVTCAVCDLPLPKNANWLTEGSAEACSWECNEGFYQTAPNHFGHQLCLPCKAQADCDKGTVLVNTCPVVGGCTAVTFRACPYACKRAWFGDSTLARMQCDLLVSQSFVVFIWVVTCAATPGAPPPTRRSAARARRLPRGRCTRPSQSQPAAAAATETTRATGTAARDITR
jgi:hypothetical protein